MDSDDLKDLTRLTEHVKDSAVLVLIQSQSVLSRPYCLLELLTAVRHGVPIVGLSLVGGAKQYNFADAAHWLSNLDSLLEHNDDARNLLAEHGWEDLTEVAYLLSCDPLGGSRALCRVVLFGLTVCPAYHTIKYTVAGHTNVPHKIHSPTNLLV